MPDQPCELGTPLVTSEGQRSATGLRAPVGARSGLNDAWISEANTSVSSQAAKWPALSTSLKYVTLG